MAVAQTKLDLTETRISALAIPQSKGWGQTARAEAVAC